jgi:hypothetical protein
MGKLTRRGWFARWTSETGHVAIGTENIGVVTVSVYIGRTYIPEDYTPLEARAASIAISDAVTAGRPVTIMTRGGASTAGADLTAAEALEAAEAFTTIAEIVEQETAA